MKKLTSILLVLSLCTSLYGCSRMGTNIYNGLNNKRLETKSTGLDNTCINWFFIPNNESRTPDINDKLNFKLSDYDAIYNGPKSPNVKSLYLTFDEGYENGYTEQILDVLKEKNVKAIFFVTSHYITYSTDVFNKELTDVEDKFKELTGKDMPKFFRPPMGQYSEKSLAMTKDLGYKTVFWSFAYGDYEPSNQPSPYEGKKNILDHLHDGSILLLHAISKTNADILGEVIDEARKSGYEFYLLP